MEVEYIKGLGCPVHIIWGKEAKAITIKDAKQLQTKLAQVIEQAEKKPELSEFELKLLDWLSSDTCGEIPMDEMKKCVKNRAEELLDLAKEEVLKDLPRWKKKEEDKFGYYCSCGFLISDGYEISIAELKRKLPRVEEN